MNERNGISSARAGAELSTRSSANRGGAEVSNLKTAIIQRFGLTNREADVAIRLMEGDSYKEAAETLGITVNTVNAHVTEILRKAGVKSSRRLASVLMREISHRAGTAGGESADA